MAKDYYESTGSDYLNSSPSVEKQQPPSVPQHTHDDRYYRKDEIDASQNDYDEKFQEVGQDISQVRRSLDDKASINHTHSNATNTTDGFMSAEDKRSLSNLTVTRTNIHITDTTARTFPAATTTKLIFDTERTDSRGEYDKPTDVVTVTKSGMYMITGTVELSNTNTSSSRVYLQVYKNGILEDTFGATYILSNIYGAVAGSTSIYLEEGDSITFHVLPSLQVTSRGKTHMKVTRLW